MKVPAIGIVGIGLIGSSLARAFRTHSPAAEIVIFDTHAPHIEDARRFALGTHYADSLADVAAHAEIAFICTPVASIAKTVRALAPHLKPGAILTDVGSVKSSIIADVAGALPTGVSFVPGHPIAGTEHSGPAAGKADLFEGKTYIIIDGHNPPSPAADKIAMLARTIGANPVFMAAAEHDLTLAFISHLPHVVAYSMMTADADIAKQLGYNPGIYAAGSFRDMTRVAASHSAMWRDIFLDNAEHVSAAYKILRTEMDALIGAVERGDGKTIDDILERGRTNKLRQLERNRS